MTDLISRQALMKEFSDFVRESNNSDFAQTPTWNDAVSLVGSMPSAQQWIPCSERLPETANHVLATIKWGEDDYEVTEVDYWIDTNIAGNIIAWMPLPEPWKGEERWD